MFSQSGCDGIEGIVLDAVGTLIDPAPSVSEAYALAARRQGVSLPLGEIKRRFLTQFGTDEIDEQRGPLATDEPTERRRWRRIVAGCLPELPDPDRAFDELWDHFGEPGSWIVFPDVAPAVLALRNAGFRLCVASNFDGRLHRVAAGLAELRDWIEPLVISSEVGFRKPHESFYKAACDRLGLPARKVISVGDDLQNDLLGPAKAGLRSVLIARNGRARDDVASLDGLDSLVEHLVEGRNNRK
ncbi:MAG: yjjG [Planctomycetota bacterium]|nr:yjjG [Planctomycetota bacterium]